MRIWLDDIRPAPAGYIHHTDPEVVIELLLTGQVTAISFDHDLGEDMLSGYDVAKVIEQLAFEACITRVEWQIHSANPVGRKNIEAAMRNADKYWQRNKA